ncbi:hypothetical protein RPE78_16315 (plasmid) [Thioclava litoralis]|uniref:Uncharacterized protein n=1 Tax=Thioclava litoralis TaxID=3076557 RepID=A0ABZ1E6D1_9RHOB|nr:hypothetical protein RPE78_16315 [Thioclava sp. FTW29]
MAPKKLTFRSREKWDANLSAEDSVIAAELMARLRGPNGVKDEFLLAAIAQNL